MILGIKKLKFIKEWIQFKGNGNPYVLFFHGFFLQSRLEWCQNITAQ